MQQQACLQRGQMYNVVGKSVWPVWQKQQSALWREKGGNHFGVSWLLNQLLLFYHHYPAELCPECLGCQRGFWHRALLAASRSPQIQPAVRPKHWPSLKHGKSVYSLTKPCPEEKQRAEEEMDVLAIAVFTSGSDSLAHCPHDIGLVRWSLSQIVLLPKFCGQNQMWELVKLSISHPHPEGSFCCVLAVMTQQLPWLQVKGGSKRSWRNSEQLENKVRKCCSQRETDLPKQLQLHLEFSHSYLEINVAETTTTVFIRVYGMIVSRNM